MSSTCKVDATNRIADLKTALSMSKVSPRDFFFRAAELCNPHVSVGLVVAEICSYTKNNKSYACPDWVVGYALSILVARGVHDGRRGGIGTYVGHSGNHQ